MFTTPRLALVSFSVGVALALAPSSAGASSEESDGGVVDAVTISAPVDDVPSFGDGPVDSPGGGSTVDGPVDAPIVVDDAETISAPVDDAETISAPVDDDDMPAGVIVGGVVIAGAGIAGAVVRRRARPRSAVA